MLAKIDREFAVVGDERVDLEEDSRFDFVVARNGGREGYGAMIDEALWRHVAKQVSVIEEAEDGSQKFL